MKSMKMIKIMKKRILLNQNETNKVTENPRLALEVDSLLDLGKNYLPSFELNGHYEVVLPN